VSAFVLNRRLKERMNMLASQPLGMHTYPANDLIIISDIQELFTCYFNEQTRKYRTIALIETERRDIYCWRWFFIPAKS
jgi:hypothetical protein